MGKRYSLEQAADFLSGYRSSGLSMRSYARHRGISESYLGRLSREESKKGESSVSESAGGFVEVARPSVLNRCHVVEIQLFNGTTVSGAPATSFLPRVIRINLEGRRTIA